MDFSKNAEIEQNTGKKVLNYEEYLKKAKEERIKNDGGSNNFENKPSYLDNNYNKNNNQQGSEKKNGKFCYEDYLQKKKTITSPNYVNNKKEMDTLENDFNKLGNNFSNFPNNNNQKSKNFSDNDFMNMPNQFSNNNNNKNNNFNALNFTIPNKTFDDNPYENIDLDNSKPKTSLGFNNNNNFNMNTGMDNYGRQSNNNFPGNNYMNTNNMMNYAMNNPQMVNNAMSHMTMDNMNRGMNTMNQMNNMNFNNNQQNNKHNNNDFFNINNLNFP